MGWCAQVMHAFQSWVQQYQDANRTLLQSLRKPMALPGTSEGDSKSLLTSDASAGSLEAFAQMQSMIQHKTLV